ncbi:MAG: transglycosylase domain-containing protein [Patescibacteria group bacterium]|nr:transglycosylase domain-containing protein [Patescibacteria group bacterium]
MVLTIAIAVILAGAVATAGVLAWVARDLPDPNNLQLRNLAQTSRIYDRTGEHILYEIHGDQKRTVVELKDISPYVMSATVAAEDRRFYEHHGFDPKGFLRAIWSNLLAGGKAQGGSTITQQFVKKAMLSDEKTYLRKVKELIISLEIERRYTKDQILKLYLNEIPYGSVVYGIESASQTFFGKPAKELDIAEAALLAALPNSPTRLSPFGTHRDELLDRMNYVIDTMAEMGNITAAEAEAAKKEDVLARVQPKLEGITAPHFVFYVRELLADKLGEQALERDGLKVITTLDWDRQMEAEQAITDKMKTIQDYGGTTAAMLAVDPRQGEIVAMVGSPDYFNDENNGKFNALLGKIQPGSSIKPMVYAAGFEKGYTPDTVLYDVTTAFEDKPPEQRPYTPHDYDGGERGPVTVREALAGSLNIPAVKMLYLVGIDDFLATAKKLGYTTFTDRSRIGLSLTLGGGEVYPLEHIAAFSVFARDGLIREPKSILRVEDASGKILLDESEPVPEKRVFSEQAARQVNNILSDNAARAYIFGEKNWLTLPDRPVAAKTGTTNNYRDAWAIGYTPSLVAGVWVGRHDGHSMSGSADGSKVAAPIWNAFMRAALADQPVEYFTAPEPVITGKPVLDGQKNASFAVKIDRATGKLATEFTPPDYVEEKMFSAPHDILFFCRKDDPRGAAPDDPASDPQFNLWERAVAAWAEKKGIVSTEPPPTEKDDVHVPGNQPAVSITTPTDATTIGTRGVASAVTAVAPRGVAKVEYAIDGETAASSEIYPFSAIVPISNRYGKGFHTLTATAFDDVGNRNSASVTFNLTAEPGPLGLSWMNTYSGQDIYASAFPFSFRLSLSDPKSISRLRLTATSSDGREEEIGSVAEPSLSRLEIIWNSAPPAGAYTIRAEATLIGGDTRTENVGIVVR